MVENGHGYEYDLVTIGAGSGGTRASRLSAAIYKKKVAIVEVPFGYVAGDDVGGAGGTCVIRGCVPKKLLVYASEFSEEFHDAAAYGWGAENGYSTPEFSWERLIQHKNKEIQRLNKVYTNLLKNSGCEYIEGRGSVVDPHTVEVTLGDGSTRRLSTANILIATGAKPVRINIPGAEHAIVSDHALVLDEYPHKGVAVIGGGYIAVEFAGIFSGLGAAVHLMYRKDLPLRGFDADVRKQVVDNLQGRGIQLHPSSTPTRIEKLGEGDMVLYYKEAGSDEEKSLECSIVMMGTGRKANSKDIGLEAAGVKLQEKSGSIVVDEYSRSSVSNIWAIGDVTDRMNLTPVALMEGKALVKTLWGGVDTKPDYDLVPTAVFCQPPVGTVGMTEEMAIEMLEGDIDIYISKFKALKNTLTGRDEKTFMKLLVHRASDKVVGVHMVGHSAGEIMTPMAVALKCGATKRQFDETVGVHPSSSEEFVTMTTVAKTVQGKGIAKM